jgi:hypothetical protein
MYWLTEKEQSRKKEKKRERKNNVDTFRKVQDVCPGHSPFGHVVVHITDISHVRCVCRT